MLILYADYIPIKCQPNNKKKFMKKAVFSKSVKLNFKCKTVFFFFLTIAETKTGKKIRITMNKQKIIEMIIYTIISGV